MATSIRIPTALHSAIPADLTVSGVIRSLLENAVEDPTALISAITNLPMIKADQGEVGRYAVYLPDAERMAADVLASSYRLSLSLLVQILLEDMLFRAGKWPVKPPEVDKTTNKD